MKKIVNLSVCSTIALVAIMLTASVSRAASTVVNYRGGSELRPGMIVIQASNKSLYLIVENGKARKYPVATFKPQYAWWGWARIQSKHWMPAWSPPAIVRQNNPSLPNLIPGGHPSNPMGVAAIMLDRTEIAIHGTSPSMRSSIGKPLSTGCIRMYNEDVTDLFQRVGVGTVVLMKR